MKWEEVQRIENTTGDPDIDCLGCGRSIHLYYNGGELDGRECCGYRYYTQIVRVDLFVERRVSDE